MMRALEQGQLFSRRDIQAVLDALNGVNEDMTVNAPYDAPVMYYRRGFEAAIRAVSQALGVPRQANQDILAPL